MPKPSRGNIEADGAAGAASLLENDVATSSFFNSLTVKHHSFDNRIYAITAADRQMPRRPIISIVFWDPRVTLSGDTDLASSSPLAGFDGGCQFIVEASACNADALRDAFKIESLCQKLITDLSLQVVGQPQRHVFPEPGGVTLLYLLSESHLACHTYPEFGFVTFNLYSCLPKPDWSWKDELQHCLGAGDVSGRKIHRTRPVGDDADATAGWGTGQ